MCMQQLKTIDTHYDLKIHLKATSRGKYDTKTDDTKVLNGYDALLCSKCILSIKKRKQLNKKKERTLLAELTIRKLLSKGHALILIFPEINIY